MYISKQILKDNEGDTIGSASNYVQQYKELAAGIRSTTKNPVSSKDVQTGKSLPEKWEVSTEREILVYYCKRFKCENFADIEEKSSTICSVINRLFKLSLTAANITEKMTEHITLDDFLQEEKSSVPIKSAEKAKSRRKLNINLSENNYKYKKGLKPLTTEQLDLCSFVNSKDLAFSSDDYDFFLAVLPGKEKVFDSLFDFSPKEKVLYEMFKEQLNNEHKAKKLVLMSRLISDSDNYKNNSKKIRKKISKKN